MVGRLRSRARWSPPGADGPGSRPLRVAGGLLYLERYWQQEEQVRIQLQRRLTAEPPQVDADRLAAGLRRLFPAAGSDSEPDAQLLAAAVTALSWVSVLSGGPGTGKTTTVARLLALLCDQPGPPPRIALAAPTGKAAARLEEAVRGAAADLPDADRQRLGELRAQTVHRLLGWQPQARGRFRHDATNQLPHDVVVVDETSMVSLTLMARLLEAVRQHRPAAAGRRPRPAVVGGGRGGAGRRRPSAGSRRSAADGASGRSGGGRARDCRSRCTASCSSPGPGGSGRQIDALARAIRAGDDDEVMAVLRAGSPEVRFVEVDPDAEPGVAALHEVAGDVQQAGAAMLAAARAGDVRAALLALDRHRLLCGHRRGPYGVGRWSLEVERWLAEAVPGYAEDGEWYLGRPLLVTANDYEMGLYNGDTGVIVDTPAGVRAAFARGAEATLFPPVRLDAVQTVHAMTVHRAQGSQFDRVTFLVPPPTSPLLTRELLYTAVTRAKEQVLLIGAEAAIRRAVSRPANRASGLRHRLG